MVTAKPLAHVKLAPPTDPLTLIFAEDPVVSNKSAKCD